MREWLAEYWPECVVCGALGIGIALVIAVAIMADTGVSGPMQVEGAPAWWVRCSAGDDCAKEAQRRCPRGYDVLGQRTDPQTTLVLVPVNNNTGLFPFTSTIETLTLVVRCR